MHFSLTKQQFCCCFRQNVFYIMLLNVGFVLVNSKPRRKHSLRVTMRINIAGYQHYCAFCKHNKKAVLSLGNRCKLWTIGIAQAVVCFILLVAVDMAAFNLGVRDPHFGKISGYISIVNTNISAPKRFWGAISLSWDTGSILELDFQSWWIWVAPWILAIFFVIFRLEKFQSENSQVSRSRGFYNF